MESTSYATEIDGVPVRCWMGRTQNGTLCKVFVHTITAKRDEDLEEFGREMQTLPAAQIVPLSYLL